MCSKIQSPFIRSHMAPRLQGIEAGHQGGRRSSPLLSNSEFQFSARFSQSFHSDGTKADLRQGSDRTLEGEEEEGEGEKGIFVALSGQEKLFST